MIVVDSSVWIANLRGLDTLEVAKLKQIDDPSDIVVGDVVMLEVLQGARDDRRAAVLERHLRQFTIARMMNERAAAQAAASYRNLRHRGVTARKTIDIVIGSYCIANGYSLLHADRDFEPMARHLGLQIY